MNSETKTLQVNVMTKANQNLLLKSTLKRCQDLIQTT